MYETKGVILSPRYLGYLLPFDGPLPLPPPDGLPVVDGQLPPGPGCDDGPRDPPFPELLEFELLLFDMVILLK